MGGMSTYPPKQQQRPMTDEEYARYSPWQQQLQNQQQPYNPYADPRGYGPYRPIQQPPGYSPLSEADVQRIAEAVVLRLRLQRAERGCADTTAA